MLELAVAALVIALIAGALGFTGIASAVAKIAFGIFLIIAVVLLLLVWMGVSLFT